jgi:flavin reductase (DIM6/NTAB) family NADH-FMN oxidoreductase RutF
MMTDNQAAGAADAHARPLTSGHFRNVFREHPAGVALITADPGGGFAPAALTATSVISLNAAPPTIAFSLSEHSSSAPALRAAETVVVHFLDEESIHLAKLGSTHGIDRFADTELWGRLESGEPYFKDAGVWIQGKIVGKLDTPGSTVIAVEGLTTGGRRVESPRSAAPLVYYDRTWHHLGRHSTIGS